jgi:hypothetical protein
MLIPLWNWFSRLLLPLSWIVAFTTPRGNFRTLTATSIMLHLKSDTTSGNLLEILQLVGKVVFTALLWKKPLGTLHSSSSFQSWHRLPNCLPKPYRWIYSRSDIDIIFSTCDSFPVRHPKMHACRPYERSPESYFCKLTNMARFNINFLGKSAHLSQNLSIASWRWALHWRHSIEWRYLEIHSRSHSEDVIVSQD